MENITSIENVIHNIWYTKEAFVSINFFVFLLIYPIYSSVYLKNREKEQGTAVFLFLDHIYHFNRLIRKCVIIVILVSSVFIVFIILVNYNSTVILVVSFLLMPLFWIFTQVLNAIGAAHKMLISFLAIQRCILYFWPDLSWCGAHLTIWSVYSFVALFQAAKIVSNTKLGMDKLAYFIFSEDLFLLLAAVLYVPVFWSIRKLKHLPSAKLNKPHRYVLWQLLATVVYKILFMVASFSQQRFDLEDKIVNSQVIDFYVIPIISQVTYLGCNRRNRKEFVTELSKKLWFKILCCRYCSKRKSTVEPTSNAVVQLSVIGRV